MKGIHLTKCLARKAHWPAVLQTTRKGRLVASRAFTTTTNVGQEVTLSYTREEEKGKPVYEVFSPFSPIEPLTKNIYQLLHQVAARWPLRPAIECGITGRHFTYADLQDLTAKFAGVLQRGPRAGMKGVEKGDKVTIFLTNTIEYPIPFFGAIGSGAVPSPANSSFTSGELARQVLDSGARIIVTETLLEPVVTAAVATMHDPPFVYVFGKSNDGHAELMPILQDKNTPFETDPQLQPDDITGMLYSSGTTGVPKGVLVPIKSLCANLPTTHHPDVFFELPCTDEHQSSIMGLLPFFHAYGCYMSMISGLTWGSRVVTLPRFEPHTFIGALRKYKFHHLHMVPPLLSFMCLPAVTPSDLSSLKGVTCSAASCSDDHANMLKEKAPNDIFFQELFGMSETMITMMTPKGEERIGSCGKLLAGNTARVVHLETEETLPAGQEGELWVKCTGVMKEYHNNPEVTRQTMTPDGWVKTGDVAKYDDQGYFYIVDRLKELIKVKGIQVSPTEVEEQLMKHEAVMEAGVVGVPCERAGELPKAYIVKKKDVSEEELQTFVAKNMAKYKHLKGGVEFVDSLPKNAAGKLLRRVLRDRATSKE